MLFVPRLSADATNLSMLTNFPAAGVAWVKQTLQAYQSNFYILHIDARNAEMEMRATSPLRPEHFAGGST
tara:strand:+ start:860 stop:1069 length:210 start_codon:yes stop_codon:yes gene_type:complete